MRGKVYAVLVLGFVTFSVGCGKKDSSAPLDVYPFDDQLRLHHVQTKGTHNSYHLEPEEPIHDSHRYSHLPLDQQLETQGVRTFELDLHYSDDQSPLQVLHLGLVDEESTCATLVECLGVIKGWSQLNPQHLTIMVWLEMKTGSNNAKPESLRRVEDRISSVFGDDHLLTPKQVKGDYSSVREALTTEGWPTLAQVRGKIAFVLLNSDHVTDYLALHPDSIGGLLFPAASLSQFDEPWAAITKFNDPKTEDGIRFALEKNLLVASNICNADMSDEACEANRLAGLSNGVMMLKDDFPEKVASREYWLDLPNSNPARCNEQTAPAFCVAEALENLGK